MLEYLGCIDGKACMTLRTEHGNWHKPSLLGSCKDRLTIQENEERKV